MLHDDARVSNNDELKYFSSFAQADGEVVFCIGNLLQEGVLLATI